MDNINFQACLKKAAFHMSNYMHFVIPWRRSCQKKEKATFKIDGHLKKKRPAENGNKTGLQKSCRRVAEVKQLQNKI
jgi:hypothetical protein